jgi:hypothetical protein
LSFDVADNRTIFYTMHASRVERAKSDLTAQIKRIEETGYKPRNPILDAIGLISLERSAEPTQQAIAALAREVASLRGDVGDIRSSLREPMQTVPGPHPYVDQHGFSRVTGQYVGRADWLPQENILLTKLSEEKKDTDRDRG